MQRKRFFACFKLLFKLVLVIEEAAKIRNL
jgi:hypothetical protein